MPKRTAKKPQDELILEKLDEILANQEAFAEALSQFTGEDAPIGPELEAAINKTGQLATGIDEQVPDQL